MFKRMLRALGVGGPTVDTVLGTPQVTPGGPLDGVVRIQGGTEDAVIGQVVVSLVTRAEVEVGDHEMRTTVELARGVLATDVRVAASTPVELPFRLVTPLETPLTAIGGTPLRGTTVGLATELVIAGALDKGDLDPVTVQPLASQARVLEAFARLGFGLRSADVESGRLHGVPQTLPVYQEIEFAPPSHLIGRVSEVELTFVATPHELYVVLEADRRGGLLSAGGDSYGRFRMTHDDATRSDWTGPLSQWLDQVSRRRGLFG